ncbi:MAG: DRTGG domain-containing protein [Oscillospiraceae bacterium]|nr:DRTGG domain-containing protein [Oscillospiraceae bacterium]
MTAKELAKGLGAEILAMSDRGAAAEVDGAYTGDLLSYVMGNAEHGNAWVTIMTNINIIAVALLVGTSCIIVCDGSEIDDNVVSAAKVRDVTLLRCKTGAYETCASISRLI